jgi:tRNA(fMet)-specific endonuclease VapC
VTPLLLLDTDVFSFLFKGDQRTSLYAPHLIDAQPCLSFQSVAELRYWALIRRWGEGRRNSLEVAMSKCIVLPYDDAMSQRWAEVMTVRRQSGRPIECGDA